MSHVATIELEITDLEALKEACKAMGLEFREGQQNYAWFGTHVGDYPLPEGFAKEDMGHCDHAIHVPGARYEVGVCRSRKKGKEDTWQLIWDFYGSGGLQNKLGANAGLIKQAYATAKTERAVRSHRRAKILKKERDRNGNVRIRVRL